MVLLVRLAFDGGSLLMAGFAAIVVLQIVMGRISLDGLLYTKDADGQRSFSPARLQLLIATVVIAAQYLHTVLAHPRLGALPPLPQSVVALLGGSQAAYLGGKAFTAFIQPLFKNSE
jgi:hypothetical protein